MVKNHFLPCFFQRTIWLAVAGLLSSALVSAAQDPSDQLPAPTPLAAGWELQDSAKVPETGDVISKIDYQPDAWNWATVPGTVLTSLVNDGVYPDPLYGLNNVSIPDTLCRASYWYRTTFTVPPAYRGRQVWLNFYGINYKAAVWVNGHNLGTIQGTFDVTSLFRAT